MFLSCNVSLTTPSSWSGCPSFLKCWDVLWIWSFLGLVGSNPMLLLVVKPAGIYWYYSIIRELNKVTWPMILIPLHQSFKKYLLNNYLALLFFFRQSNDRCWGTVSGAQWPEHVGQHNWSGWYGSSWVLNWRFHVGESVE